MKFFAQSEPIKNVRSIFSSQEVKARDAAEILSAALGIPYLTHQNLGENDRSATGFLPPAAFEKTADAFFANPTESVCGWEKAADAQQRITKVFEEIIGAAPTGNIAVVAHGGVGTLLLCHLLHTPISRRHDQPHQGNYWAFDMVSKTILHVWKSIAP